MIYTQNILRQSNAFIVCILTAITLMTLAPQTASLFAAFNPNTTVSTVPSKPSISYKIVNKKRETNLSSLPAVLDSQNQTLYREIFIAQENSRWKQARELTSQLTDPLLMGSVLAHRYLHKDYLSSPEELKNWLERYSDHTERDQIAALAYRKGVAGSYATLPASSEKLLGSGDSQHTFRFGKQLVSQKKSWERGSQAERQWSNIRSLLRQGKRDLALKALNHNHRAFSSRDYDLVRWYIANSAFNNGEYRDAYHLASASAGRSGYHAPSMHWLAGISSWHLKDYRTAYRHFSTMAKASNHLQEWDAAAAEFWAYRSAERLNQTKNAQLHLKHAAAYPRSFYGIQANTALNQKPALNLIPSRFTASTADKLLKDERLRRIVALYQVDRTQQAEKESRDYYPQLPPHRQNETLSLAMLMDVPAVQIRMALDLSRNLQKPLDYALYPTPGWQPYSGYAVDPALIFAIARQESGFDTLARSYAGASGVMQLMPATARYLIRQENLALGASSPSQNQYPLQEPVANITLGQRYLDHLMKMEFINDNLVFVAAAYNAGPANLQRWVNELHYHDDPMLFVESIPYGETRNYVLNILTNYWMYNEVMGRKNPSAASLLAGFWPTTRDTTAQIADVTTKRLTVPTEQKTSADTL